MRRALIILVFLAFFPLAFLPADVSGVGPCSNSLSPPFVAAGVKPNILILLDNSLSFDEDFYGNAVGSYASASQSKSVVARQALQNLVVELKSKANVGIMTFSLPGDVQPFLLYNSLPFASYDSNSYCKNAPSDCATYCSTGDTTAKTNCDAVCGNGFTSHVFATTGTNFPDEIIGANAQGSANRTKYCGLTYPKLYSWHDPNDSTGPVVYYNQADALYVPWGNFWGTEYGYCSSYSTLEHPPNPYNSYGFYHNKTNQSDANSGYTNFWNNLGFEPTDSDWALGYYNFGRRVPFYFVGPTWFSNSGSSGSPQGYLHVPVGDISNNTDGTNSTQFNNVFNILNPNIDDTVPAPNNTPYMSCGASNKNTCSYIVNSSNTPTAGALQTALSYFSGQYTGQTSPIGSVCQKNYIIFVTDGLPSTLKNGTQTTNISQLMPEVLQELDSLQSSVTKVFNGTSYVFPVKTYVLGMGLTAQAKTQLDQMAIHGGTVQSSGHAYYADDPSQLGDALETIITNLLGRVSSGTSISILSEGQTMDGSNMLQGVFYPTKYYGTKNINWPGYLYDWWFYVTPQNNNIREDTVHDYILGLKNDDALSFVFDAQIGLSVNRYSDPLGTGNATSFVDNVGLDSLTPIWEAGRLLFQQTPASRQIYTPGISSSGLVSFDTSNATLTSASSPLGNPSNFDPCLNGSLANLINYVRGNDISFNHCSDGVSFNSTLCTQNSQCTTGTYTKCLPEPCRNRTMSLCTNGTDFNSVPCASNSDCTASPYTTCGAPNVWKLGDIVYSTPKVQTDYKYCSSGTSFTTTPCSFDSDCTTGTNPSCKKKESVVYVGANDGMLHAFKTGILSINGVDPSQGQIVKLTGIPTTDMGKELWSFIPQNSLPYLRCLAIPPPNTCHLYYSDLSPYITTMVSNGVSKTVLIGGMRLGGGAIASGKYCLNSSGVSNGTICGSISDCGAPYNASCATAYYLNAPSDTCTQSFYSNPASLCASPATCYNPASCTGLSSYYALDITDAENPKLLWEFSHPFLGYTYSGPAVIHKWSNASTLTGDQYYVMFLSGPTNPADGSSIQKAQGFILWLNNDLSIKSVYYNDFGAVIQNGFGGRLFTSGLDVNADGYTDFVLFGYSSSPSSTTTGWQGGIGKIYTGAGDPTIAMDPKNWTYDLSSYANIASLPITAKIGAQQCFNTWYLYAGTGRYFFPQDNYSGTAGSLNSIMGIPFTCLADNTQCTSVNSLNNSTTACANVKSGNYAGGAWEYSLTGASGSFLSERMYTDPTTTDPVTSACYNSVYFTTAQPISDPCSYGGQSRVWELNCATGAALNDSSCTGFSLPGGGCTIYLQTSTGAITRLAPPPGPNPPPSTPFVPGMAPETSSTPVQSPIVPARAGQLMQWMEK